MALLTLKDLFIHELQDLYNAEGQLVDALPKMAETASSPELKQAFTSHLEETKDQQQKVKSLIEKLGETPGGEKCNAMEGLIEEGSEMIDKDADEEVKDAGLIACAQRVEHYEIAGYGTARAYADRLGETEAEQVLAGILDQEKDANEKLTDLAVTGINKSAMA